MMLGLVITGGVLLLLVIIFSIVFLAIRSAMARQRSELEAEGVELDSGPLWITLHLRNYRGPGRAVGVGVSRNRGRLVLTRQHLTVLGFRYLRFPRGELGRFTASVEGGALRLHSDAPPGATGTMEIRIPVGNVDAWIAALRAAGVA